LSYVASWIEYLKGKLTGDQPLFEILPGLFISSEIRDPAKVREAGIEAVVDLAGGFDPEALAEGLVHYHYWPIKDEPVIPEQRELYRVAMFALGCYRDGMRVMIH